METTTTRSPDTASPTGITEKRNPVVDISDPFEEDLECVPDTDTDGLTTSQNEEKTRKRASPNSPNETSVPNRAGGSPSVNDRETRKGEGKTSGEKGEGEVGAAAVGEDATEGGRNVEHGEVNTEGQNAEDSDPRTHQDNSEEESMLELLNRRRRSKRCTRAAWKHETGQTDKSRKPTAETEKPATKPKSKTPKADSEQPKEKLKPEEKDEKQPTNKRIRVRTRGKKRGGEAEPTAGEGVAKRRVRRRKGDVEVKENEQGEVVATMEEEEGGLCADNQGILEKLRDDYFEEFLVRNRFGQQSGDEQFHIDMGDMALLYVRVQTLRAQGFWEDPEGGASQDADESVPVEGREWKWAVLAEGLPFCNDGVHAWALYTRYLLAFDRANKKLNDALAILETEAAAASQFVARVAAEPLTSAQIEKWTLDKMLNGLTSSLPLSATGALNGLLIYTYENEIVIKTNPAVLSAVLNYTESLLIECGISLVGDNYRRKKLCAVGVCPNHDDCLLTSTTPIPTDRLFAHGGCPCHHLTLHIRSALIVLGNLSNLPSNCVFMASSPKFIEVVSSLLDLPGVWRAQGLLEQILEVTASATDWLLITHLENDWPVAAVVVERMVCNLIDLVFDCGQPDNENEERILVLSLEVLSRLVFSEGFNVMLDALQIETRQKFVDLIETQLCATWCEASCYALLIASTLSEISAFQDLLANRAGFLRALVEVISESGRIRMGSETSEPVQEWPNTENDIAEMDKSSVSDGEGDEEGENESLLVEEERESPWGVRAVAILCNLSNCKHWARQIAALERELVTLAFRDSHVYTTATETLAPDTRAALCGLLARM